MEPGEIESLTLSFIWTNAANATMAQHALENSPELSLVLRRERMSALSSAIVLAVVTALALPRVIQVDEPGTRMVLGGLGVVAGILYFMYGNSKGRWHAYRDNLLASSYKTQGDLGAFKVKLHVDGIQIGNADYTTVHNWKLFGDVYQLPDYLVVAFSGAANGVIIPRTAFPSDKTMEAWGNMARDRINAAGFSEATRVLANIESWDAHCGKCGQSLKGLREPKCPECGTQLTTLRLNTWRAAAQPWWNTQWTQPLRTK